MPIAASNRAAEANTASSSVLKFVRAVDSAIAFEHPAEARHVVAVVGAGQPGHDGREKLFLVALRRGVDPGLGTRQHFGLLLGLGALSLQDESIESDVFVGVEA